tara:strand:+ start:73 stop:615 length:543 start_codon:yes stop_codon:yes gene_type:complete
MFLNKIKVFSANSIFIILIFLICNVVKSQEIKIIEGNAIVTDGDSIKIDNKKIRLLGIDAPELRQLCFKDTIDAVNVSYMCGEISKQKLQNYISGKKIVCEYTNLDRYKRILGLCKFSCVLGDADCAKFSLNKYMVRSGNALAYKKYSKKYLEDQEWAQNNKLGIWAGEFEEPENWRKNN